MEFADSGSLEETKKLQAHCFHRKLAEVLESSVKFGNQGSHLEEKRGNLLTYQQQPKCTGKMQKKGFITQRKAAALCIVLLMVAEQVSALNMVTNKL